MAKKEEKKVAPKKGNNKEAEVKDMKAQKRKERLEKLKDRPAVQRPNSRQVNITEGDFGKVISFGYAVRKTGTIVTEVLVNKKGEPVGISSVFVPGTKVKVKKNHGSINPGVAGSGKKKGDEEEGDEEEED